MYIYEHYTKNPDILKPDVVSRITRRKFVDCRDENGKIQHDIVYEDLEK
jgi:hypothetical protein